MRKHPSWNARTTNQNGRLLRQHADRMGYQVIGPHEHTFYRAGAQPDTLDIALAVNIHLQYQIEVADELSSDHNPVILSLIPDAPDESDINTLHITNWEAYKAHLEQHCSAIRLINTTEEIDQATERL